MSDLIEDDYGAALDVEELPEVEEPDWFDCRILDRAEMFDMIKRHGALDSRSLNLFSVLNRAMRSGLVEHYVFHNLYRPGSHYIYVTPDAKQYRYGCWRPVMTKAAAEGRAMLACSLISNTLSWGDTRPRERAFNAGFAIYTIEFDHMPLNEQLRIIWSGKLNRISREFEQYQDYRGYEVIYSGNKSLHFHVVFDLRHLKHELAFAANGPLRDKWRCDLPDPLLRPSHAVCWDRLAGIFREIAEIDDQPDPTLREWERLRRGPWALRRIRDAHPFGLPLGHRIWQVVLATDVFQNTKRGATA
jgi:hypothetical protein